MNVLSYVTVFISKMLSFITKPYKTEKLYKKVSFSRSGAMQVSASFIAFNKVVPLLPTKFRVTNGYSYHKYSILMVYSPITLPFHYLAFTFSKIKFTFYNL